MFRCVSTALLRLLSALSLDWVPDPAAQTWTER